MRYPSLLSHSLRHLGAAAALSGTLLLLQPGAAFADSPLTPDSPDVAATVDALVEQIPSEADRSPAKVEGRSPVQAAAEITKNFAEASPQLESMGELGVSIENLAAEAERQKTKEIELAYIEAAMQEEAEDLALIAEEERRAAEAAAQRQALVDTALAQVGTPYVSGGAAPGGFDCSGLVKYCVAQIYGYEMPRTAAAQAGEGESVSFDELQLGDLLFWGSGSGIYHVAIYVGDGQYVHAPRPGQSVKVQTLESYTPTFSKRLSL